MGCQGRKRQPPFISHLTFLRAASQFGIRSAKNTASCAWIMPQSCRRPVHFFVISVMARYSIFSSSRKKFCNPLQIVSQNGLFFRLPLIIAPKPAVSSSATQSFEKKRNSSALFAREINLVTQPSFDCEQGINSQVQTVCSNADAVFPVLGIVFCKNERFSLSRKTHVPLWNEPRISHVRLP